MEKKDLTITISGKIGTGKTFMALMLEYFLRSRSANVTIEAETKHDALALMDARKSFYTDKTFEELLGFFNITIKPKQEPNG